MRTVGRCCRCSSAMSSGPHSPATPGASAADPSGNTWCSSRARLVVADAATSRGPSQSANGSGPRGHVASVQRCVGSVAATACDPSCLTVDPRTSWRATKFAVGAFSKRLSATGRVQVRPPRPWHGLTPRRQGVAQVRAGSIAHSPTPANVGYCSDVRPTLPRACPGAFGLMADLGSTDVSIRRGSGNRPDGVRCGERVSQLRAKSTDVHQV
jgi:hypothetical protein